MFCTMVGQCVARQMLLANYQILPVRGNHVEVVCTTLWSKLTYAHMSPLINRAGTMIISTAERTYVSIIIPLCPSRNACSEMVEEMLVCNTSMI